ncbi:MAG: HI0933 family protein [Candidatus Magasanikbacteria bacterium GW2011_GWA2_37_8]|uniref:HI0933 family protein n=1 Tax=Candidatus Magasanikbacteria bacterium GW2011_GWA2_37_8 TaxID=1619036 RepID=A0A0G0JUP7_9BACT|nr:MAG: HI0933 family protein [Candidatus Magasanikbacteria bacterium GW2011_GWA2_37_8]
MHQTNKSFDIIIIGGGAAGMMAAISAKRHNPKLSVAIIDQTFALGRKILISGAGRCNLTNKNLTKDLTKKYFGDKKIIESVFKQFGYKEITEFFNGLGLELYEETKSASGKIFPKNDQAKAVVALLISEIERLNIESVLNTTVLSVKKDKKVFVLTGNCENKEVVYTADKLVLAAGGKSYPALGADGSGFDLAHDFKHRIIEPVPSGVPLVGKNELSQALQGTKLEAEITAYINNKKADNVVGDVLFTQYGLSGSGILSVSRGFSIELNRNHKNFAEVVLNFFPDKNSLEVKKYLAVRFKKHPDQTIENNLWGIFPMKFVFTILKLSNVDPLKRVNKLKVEEIEKLINNLTACKINITGTRGWNEAEFTAGGVAAEDVDPNNLESKLVSGLYFCGEVLDVDGEIGGYNLSWAWASGFVVGESL